MKKKESGRMLKKEEEFLETLEEGQKIQRFPLQLQMSYGEQH